MQNGAGHSADPSHAPLISAEGSGCDCRAPTVRPIACLWLIGNPVSGQGRGRVMIDSITRELTAQLGHHRVRTLSSTEFFAAFCGGGARDSSLESSAREMDAGAVHEAVRAMHALHTESSNMSCDDGDVAAFVLRTERAKDGVEMADAIGHLNCRHRLMAAGAEGSAVGPCEAWLHIISVVGGDGSLSDAVNGLCRGTLRAHAEASTPPSMVTQHGGPARGGGWATTSSAPAAVMASMATSADHDMVGVARGDSGVGNGECSPPLGHDGEPAEVAVAFGNPVRQSAPSPFPALSSECGGRAGGNEVAAAAAALGHTSTATANASLHYYRRVLCDRSLLRHLLPAMIYAPGGTGADFAKLRLCCATPEDAVAVFRGVVSDFFPRTLGSGSGRWARASGEVTRGRTNGRACVDTMSSTTLSNTVAPSRFLAYEVDVGRITFPRTGHSAFFINECSIGMSCDVVQRGELFKRSRLLTALGGRLLFASSAAVSLLRMAPKTIRVARLAPTPALPSMTSTTSVDGERSATATGAAVKHAPLARHTPASIEGRAVGLPRLPAHIQSAAVAREMIAEDVALLDAACLPNAQLAQDYYCFFCNPAPDPRRPGSRLPSTLYRMPAPAELVTVRASACDGLDEDDTRPERDPPTHCADGQGETAVELTMGAVEVIKGAVPVYAEDPMAARARLDLSPSCPPLQQQQQLPDVPHTPATPSGRAAWVYLPSSTLAFGNGRWYGGGMHVTPHANPMDGLLSCTSWVATVLPFVRGVFSLYSGAHVRWSSTTAFDGERFLVDAGPRRRTARPHAPRDAHESPTACTASTSSASAGDDEAWVGEREEMFMEADGELLEALPAVVELGGVLTLLTTSTEVEARRAACVGVPAPGTYRAWEAARASRAGVTAPTAAVATSATGGAHAPVLGNGDAPDGAVEVAVKVNVGPLTHAGVGAARGSTWTRVGWLARGWRGVRRLFSHAQGG